MENPQEWCTVRSNAWFARIRGTTISSRFSSPNQLDQKCNWIGNER